MANTSINLGDHFTHFLADLTKSGRYGSVSEAVRAGLRLLEKEEAQLQTLRQALIKEEESGKSDRSLDDIFADIKERITHERDL